MTIFDPDPNHIWNRTYACLFVRQDAHGAQYGGDTPDPLLWDLTHHLLKGDSHHAALACLDQFSRSQAGSAIGDPLKRAIFQHDLWAIFDWAARGHEEDQTQERMELETRLAEAIRSVALAPAESLALPDTYAAAVAERQFPAAYEPGDPHRAFLPPDLFARDGAWIPLSGYLDEPTAAVHFTGRSRFLIFIRLPGGRQATLDYIRTLRHSGMQPHVKNGDMTLLNLALPQFSPGTQVALVRQAILIDSEGRLVPTALTEMAQIRAYHAITPGSQYENYINGPASRDQDSFEFRFSRPKLFARRAGGLAAVHPGEQEYPTFATHGLDSFESPQPMSEKSEILRRCGACHSDSGIHSVQSRRQWMEAPHGPRPPADDDTGNNAITWETDATLARKQRQPEFQLLLKMWRAPVN